MVKKSLLKKVLILVFVFSFLALCGLAQACTIGATDSESTDCGDWTRHWRCNKNADCDWDVQKEVCDKRKSRSRTCIDDGTGNGIWGAWGAWGSCTNKVSGCRTVTVENCESWEVCDGSTTWNSPPRNHDCECRGHCLADPVREGSGAYPNSGVKDGIDFVDPNNVFLPGLFDWEKVDGANSYWWRAIPVDPSTNTQTILSSVVQEPFNEYIPEACSLQSANSYSWKVLPCCSNNGLTECRTWDSLPVWNFATNLAPEPATPTDPDWNNPINRIEDIEVPIFLDWCDSPDNQDYLGMGDTDPGNPVPLFQDEYDYEEGVGEKVEKYKLKFYSVDSAGNETCHPWLVNGGSCDSLGTSKHYSSFEDSLSTPFFIGGEKYRWEVAICYAEADSTEVCSNYSQKWEFKTEDTPILNFNLLSPPDDPLGNNAVGFPVTLNWEKKVGSNSFICTVNPGGITKIADITSSGVSFDPSELSLDSLYSWIVTPCHNFGGQDCDLTMNSSLWWFKTTGAPPNLIEPINNPPSDVIIPANFDWDDVSGAGSYKIQIQNVMSGAIVKEADVQISEISVDYPDLEMNTDYQWKVQTCAYSDGATCGNWSGTNAFKTFDIGVPPNRSPIDGEIFDKAITITLSWDSVPGAKAYQYIVYDPSGNELFNEITTSNSLSFNSYNFPDIGVHEWEVQACLTADCSVNGGWSNLWSFDVDLDAPPENRGGLVPCGRAYDDPNTPLPMDERESCQIKHLFLLLRNLLDLLLWKIGIALLVLISMIFGAIFYFSQGDEETVQRIKSLAKSVIIGYAIIFGAWALVNLLLALAGFNFQFFGHWWEIKL